MSNKSSLQAENSTFFFQGHGQKSTAQNAQNHTISSGEKSFFSGEGLCSYTCLILHTRTGEGAVPLPRPPRWEGVPPPDTSLPPSLLDHHASPKIPARFTPLLVRSRRWTDFVELYYSQNSTRVHRRCERSLLICLYRLCKVPPQLFVIGVT